MISAPKTYPAFYTGNVQQFDFDVGLGHVVSDKGVEWLFHCTQIVDGSRSIVPGTAVRFEVAAGGPGGWEARQVQPLEGNK